MSGLACLFAEAGWEVSGCDRGVVHPPASTTLARLGIHPLVGYSPAHLAPPPDLVVVGNVVRETNPEDREARALNLERTHMAGALWRFFMKDRTPIVVAATHGKTTTTAILAFLLHAHGHDPGFFVGGVVRDLGTSARLGSGRWPGRSLRWARKNPGTRPPRRPGWPVQSPW